MAGLFDLPAGTSGAPTASTGLFAAPAAGAIGAPPVPEHGVGGFFANALHDVEGFATGIGSLVGLGLHDIGHAVAETATLGHAGGGYYLDDVAKALPHALAADYGSRYGSWSGFVHGLYTHPLAFLTDVASVATLGGGLAAKGAMVAAKAGEGADLIKGAMEASQAARAASVAGNTEEAAAQTAKATELAGQVQAAAPAWAKRVLPGIGTEFPGGYKSLVRGNVVEQVPRAINPIKRAITEPLSERFLTEPIGALRERLATTEVAAAVNPKLAPEVERLQSLLNQAQRLNLERLDKPIVQNWRLRRYADALFGLQGTRFIEQREQYLREVKTITDDASLTKDEMSQAHLNLQGITPAQATEMGHMVKPVRPFDVGEVAGGIIGAHPELPLEQAVGRAQGLVPRFAGQVGLEAQPGATRGEFAVLERGRKAFVREMDTRAARASTRVEGYKDPEVQAFARNYVESRKAGTIPPTENLSPKLMRIKAALDKTFEPKGKAPFTIPTEEMRRARPVPSEVLKSQTPKLKDLLAQAHSPLPVDPNAPTFEHTSMREFSAPVTPSPAVETLPASRQLTNEELPQMAKDIQATVEPTLGKATVQGIRVARDDPFMGRSSAAGIVDILMADGKPESYQAARDAMDSLGTVVNVQPFHEVPHPSGYRGLNVDVARADGSVLQVRIHTPRGIDATYSAIPIHGRIAEYQQLLDTARQIAEDPTSAPSAVLKAQRDMAVMQGHITRGNLFSRTHFQAVVQELRRDINGEVINPLDWYRESIRLWVQRRLTNPLIQQGLLELGEAFNRQYTMLRLMSGAQYDSKLHDFAGGLDPVTIHLQREAADLHAPVYFPHFNAMRVRFSDFLFNRGRNEALVGTSPFLKQNKGVLAELGKYETNPLQVYGRRAALALRHAESWNFVRSVIEKFGRPISSVEDISPHEMLFSPRGLLEYYNVSLRTSDLLMHQLGSMVNEDEAIASTLKEVMGYLHGDQAVQRDAVRSFVGVRKSTDLWAIPKVVGQRIDRQAGFNLPPAVRLFWQKPTQVWKSLVLMGSPRWVVNNLIGNTVFVGLQGANPLDVARAFMPGFKKQLAEMAAEGKWPEGVSQGFFRLGENYNIKLGMAGRGSRVADFYNMLGDNRVMNSARWMGHQTANFNSRIEDAYRTASYLKAADRAASKAGIQRTLGSFFSSRARLERVAEVGANERLATSALNEMNYFMNDYAKMGPYERTLIRPFLVPFWSFYKHVAKLIFSFPFTHPVRFVAFRQLTNIANEITNYGPAPEWLRGDVLLGPGKTPGDLQFLNTLGPNPFNAVFQNPVSLLHPGLKVLAEEATGRTALSNFSKTFTAPDVVTPFGSSQQYQVDQFGNAQPVNKVTPSIPEELLREVPQYSLLEKLIGGATPYDTAALPGIVESRLGGYPAGGAVPAVPGGGAPQYPLDAIQKLLAFGGASTINYNLSKYQTRTAQEEAAAVLQFLRQQGLAPPAGAPAQAGLFG